jgi:hypothetical protein
MLKHRLFLAALFIITALFAVACAAPAAAPADTGGAPAADADSTDAAPEEPTAETGTLTFTANGEDFVRQGFTSKDGWNISFDHVYVTLTDVEAYQTDPPYDAESGETPDGVEVRLDGTYTLDLAAGDENAEPLVIETAADAPAGQYNALSWRMIPATEGDAAGSTLLIDGTADKDGETIEFVLSTDREYAYTCGEYIGDERKGILAGGDEADLEATFHFDHIFGDGDVALDDSLNVGALGFDPLAAQAQDGTLTVTLSELEERLSAEEFATLQSTLETLGHVGEGHCFEASGGYTGAHGTE